MALRDVLLDIARDEADRWRQPWLRACALYAAWSVPDLELDRTRLTASVRVTDAAVGAGSIVEETLVALEARDAGGAPARVDPSGRQPEEVL